MVTEIHAFWRLGLAHIFWEAIIKPNGASLVAQTVKNLPPMWETQAHSLGQEDHLEKGMATHSSILAWRIPWTEEPGGYSAWGCKQLDTAE